MVLWEKEGRCLGRFSEIKTHSSGNENINQVVFLYHVFHDSNSVGILILPEFAQRQRFQLTSR
jgi:hypothetical protein